MAFFFSSSGSAWGQAATSLRGTITDPSGAAIPNATVRLTNTDTNLERTVTTDSQGNYVFSQMQPGHYSLHAQAPGFAKFDQKGIELLVNLPATLNIKMKIGAATQTVTVTERAPILNTTDASEGNTMSGRSIKDLPLEAGNVVQLLSLQPGVVYTSDRSDMNTTTDTRSGAVNGERSDQSNVTLDGVDVNDQGGGLAFTSVLPITVDSVQEFRVTTSNYGADQGRSAGAQVALITTSGTNKFHGSLYELNRSSLGQANDFFIKSAEEAQGQPNKAPQLVRNVFGGSLGGPIEHNRLFFFVNYEGHRIAQQSSAVRTIPSMELRDGIIQYQCATASQCTGGSVTGLSGTSYPVQPGNYALNASQLAAMDPLGTGPSAAVLNYFKTTFGPFTPNDNTVGDTLNFQGLRFAAGQPERDDILISRFDYKITANGSQSLFWRGSGQDDVAATSAPFLPGSQAETTTVNLSKGMAIGYTAVLGSNIVNNLHYGLTRQSVANLGDSSLPWIFIRNLDQGITRTNSFQFPVHNITDDLSWTRGNHSFTFGTDILFIHNGSSSQNNSFSDGVANAAWLNTGGFANKSSPFNPVNAGYPQVLPGTENNYDFPLIGLLGMVSEVDAQYNYHLNPNATGTALAQGAPVQRNFALYQYEWYAQDSWKAKPNLTINFGLRYGIDTAPWETSGQEVAPTFGLGNWFAIRAADMNAGVPSNLDPLISFDLAGRSNNRADLWPTQKNNFAPRVSFAWSPEPSSGWFRRLVGNGDQTVVRAGFGVYYDHFGAGMLTTFDQNGSFGLSSLLSNSAQVESAATSPRLTGMNTIPTVDNSGNPIFTPAPPAVFPETFPPGNFCICWGLDSSIKTPYSYAIDFSIERQLPHNMSIEVAYTGHLGHRLLAQADLAMPKNLKDPQSGITYFQAAQAMATLGRANGGNGTDPAAVTSATIGPTAAYWQDLISPVAAGDQYSYGSVLSPSNPSQATCGFNPNTQAGYSISPTTDPVTMVYQTYLCNSFNETSALYTFDVNGIPGANTSNTYFPTMGQYTWFNSQYSSLYAWRSMANSAYNALEVTFKKQMSQGLGFDLNYTYSKSTDLASDAERVGEWGGLGGNVINSWSPNQLYGPSDFDLRHQINANWNWDLPVGIGRHYAAHIGKGLDAIIGGWRISGLTRWSSGFPVNVGTCFCFETNWQLTGNAIAITKVKTGRTLVNEGALSQGGNGTLYNMFPNGPAAVADFAVPLPGFSGARNQIRGDGYLDTDFEVGKTWRMPYNENHELRLTWDTFNAFNVKRFNVQNASLATGNANTFGNYTHLLTNPREMQFGLRYQF
ncbi:MAG TPA: carboxypeptidase-like regulatory domain-containing protein [Candidatus Limnocylindrales bacterium]|nr:carboxypeptidase-like regulatory domain-containing protein [Candidatus Limnocylindrales bacterium]